MLVLIVKQAVLKLKEQKCWLWVTEKCYYTSQWNNLTNIVYVCDFPGKKVNIIRKPDWQHHNPVYFHKQFMFAFFYR